MRRPRHREKSNLLWKMLGIAGAINLLVWPILTHEGLFAGIRHEVLTPVSLISVPPSRKAPDILQKVPRGTAIAVLPVAPVTPKRPQPAATHGTAPPPSDRAHAPVTAQKPPPESPSPPARPVLTVSVSPALEKAPISNAQPSQPPVLAIAHFKPTGDEAASRIALAERLLRAKQLEAEGHEVAEQIASQRAARVASLSTERTTAAVALPAVVGVVSPPAPSAAPAVKPDNPPAHTPRADLPSPTQRFIPAVAVSKVHPSVPDSMMTSPWHATFRGRFTVHKDGSASVQVVSSTGFPVLDRRAIEAARQWRFQPARMNDAPVVSSQTFAFEFDVHPLR